MLTWQIRNNETDLILIRIFVVIFYLLMNMFILNILIGIILSLTATYKQKMKDQAKLESFIINKNGIIDFILNDFRIITDE